jgi:hypothetical protein
MADEPSRRRPTWPHPPFPPAPLPARLLGLALAPIIGGAMAFAAIGILGPSQGRIALLRMAGMGPSFDALYGAPAALLIG